MIIYYITECDWCNLIQVHSTSDLSKAIATCRHCGKRTKVKHTHIIKKSHDPKLIAKICQKIKEKAYDPLNFIP